MAYLPSFVCKNYMRQVGEKPSAEVERIKFVCSVFSPIEACIAKEFINSDIVNDPISAANTAVPAEFAEVFGRGKRLLAT
jgi:hypothetical protein